MYNKRIKEYIPADESNKSPNKTSGKPRIRPSKSKGKRKKIDPRVYKVLSIIEAVACLILVLVLVNSNQAHEKNINQLTQDLSAVRGKLKDSYNKLNIVRDAQERINKRNLYEAQKKVHAKDAMITGLELDKEVLLERVKNLEMKLGAQNQNILRKYRRKPASYIIKNRSTGNYESTNSLKKVIESREVDSEAIWN